MRKIHWFFLIILLLLTLNGCDKSSSDRVDPNLLNLNIIEPAKVLVGQGPTSLTLEIENLSDNPVNFLPFADGGWIHWRYPHYTIEIWDEQGEKLSVDQFARCGLMNPITENQIIEIKPGENHRWSVSFPFHPLEKPAKYKLILTYNSMINSVEDYRPKGFGHNIDKIDSSLMRKLKKAIRVKLKSAPLILHICPINKEMLEERIASYFIEQIFARTEDFTFLSIDRQQHQWYVDDIRQQNRHISCLLKFAEGYNPPKRPEHIPSEYWFNQGRYLLVPQSGNPAQGSETDTLEKLMDRFKVYLPDEAKKLFSKHEFLKPLFCDP